jgi:uncharacterized DUF497 family protein
MLVRYTFHNITFEWDSQKAAVYLRKHNVRFEVACEAFFDPFVWHVDDELVDGELRERMIGLTSSWLLLYNVYVLRDDVIRIISARLVTNTEREAYENQ